MAATEACAAPVQEDGVTETKSEVASAPVPETVNNDIVNKETVNNEVVNDEAAKTETAGVVPAAEEAQPAAVDETPAASTEVPAESKAKPAHDGIWDSFKTGLGKVMGGKKKKEQSGGAEDVSGEPQEKVNGEEAAAPAETAEATEAGAAEDQAIEKAPEGEDAEGKKDGKEAAKPKHGVRDLIRKPVARIFSHKSTEKKDTAAAAESPKQVTVRSRSLDRLEDPEACNTTVDSAEETQVADSEAQKPSAASATKHMKRWHSFKKLMAQRSHKKSTDDSKETEVLEGGAEAGAGDSSTLDSKGENSGQKRWKLKRSWTFQGLKRDSSVVGISKVAKGTDKDSEAKGEETGADAGVPVPVGESEESKEAVDGEAAEKAEGGEEDKGAAAALGTVSQHANEIWTSFKKRVTPKSKKTATENAEEEGGAVATDSPAPAADQEATEEAAGGKEAKSAKAKRTHFNRAVSLKNFILRKGKSASVDHPDGAAKDGEDEAAAGDGKAENAAADGATDGAEAESNDQAKAPVTNDHDGEEKAATEVPAAVATEATATPETATVAEPAPAVPAPEPSTPAPEVTTNGENGCTNGTAEEDVAHNHKGSPEKDEANNTAAIATGTKITKASQGNAVAQSEKKAGNV